MNKTLVQVFNSVGITASVLMTIFIVSALEELNDYQVGASSFEYLGIIGGLITVTAFILSIIFIAKIKQ